MTQTQVPTYADPTQTKQPVILTRLDAGTSLGLSVNQGDWEQDVFTAAALELAQAAYLPQNLLTQAFVLTATGSALDSKGADLNVPRKTPTPAVWTVEFTGTAGSTVPQGQLVATSQVAGAAQQQFYVTAAATIPTGLTTVNATVQAAIPGSAGNVAVGAMAVFVGSTPAGITSVGNTAQVDVGTDVEADGPLFGTATSYYRGRLLAAMRDPGSSGNPAHYMTWLTQQPVVSKAAVLRTWQGPGTVGCAFLDATGTLPTRTDVQEVETALIDPWRLTYEAITLAVSGYGVTLTGPNDGTGASAQMVYNASGAGVLTLATLQNILPQPGVWRLLLLVEVSSAGTNNLLTVNVQDGYTGAPCTTTPGGGAPCTTTWNASQLPTSFGESTFNPTIFGWIEVDFFADVTHTLTLTITRDTADTTTTLNVGSLLLQSSFSRDDRNDGLVPAGDWASIMPPLNVPVNLAVTLEYATGADLTTVQAAASAAYAASLQSVALLPPPLNTVRFGGVIQTLMAVPGVVGYSPASLLLNGAQADVSVPALSVATPGTVSIS